MKGLRNVELPRYIYTLIIKVQFGFIAVLLCLNHKTGFGTVVSSSDKNNGGKYVNRYVQLKRITLNQNVSNHNPDDLDEVYAERLRTAERVCENSDDAALDFVPTGQVWSYGDRNTSIHYCSVPKVGCTVWKRIFRFLHNDFPNDTDPSRPSEIDRWFVHYGNLTAPEQMTSMKCFSAMRTFLDGKLFLFTRNPYTRLWSAYLDKFFLPDFWRTFAMDTYKTLHNMKNVTIPKQERCFKNITFTEFLKFVISPQKSPNEHWVPVSKLCSPCHAKVDFIGKQETFFRDYEYILKKYKLGNLVEHESVESRVMHETSMLIKYNFGLKKRFVNQTGCFVPLDIAERLWKVFQYNGYIHDHNDFPEKALNMISFESDPVKEVSRLMDQTLEDQHRLGLSFDGQKRAHMVKAYKAVPRDVLNEVQDFFIRDFDMFDYEKSPRNIF